MSLERPIYVAFDFDGTLVTNEYPNIGSLIVPNLNVLLEHHRAGHRIIIWTCRHGDELYRMTRWLDANKVPYDWINENREFETGSRKIYADIYYDDRNAMVFVPPVKV